MNAFLPTLAALALGCLAGCTSVHPLMIDNRFKQSLSVTQGRKGDAVAVPPNKEVVYKIVDFDNYEIRWVLGTSPSNLFRRRGSITLNGVRYRFPKEYYRQLEMAADPARGDGLFDDGELRIMYAAPGQAAFFRGRGGWMMEPERD